jgi:hypothetical protein
MLSGLAWADTNRYYVRNSVLVGQLCLLTGGAIGGLSLVLAVALGVIK